jgi:carnosine N-methyltransferase
LRDWSTNCAHVGDSTYNPAIAELKALLPNGGEVLLPGCGLGRLALDCARQGFAVEANDASRLFLTVADYILNRPPAVPAKIFPVAHVFSENWSVDQQYIEIETPKPSPMEVATGGSCSGGYQKAPEVAADMAKFVMVPGDFVKTYAAGCPGHRKFDAILSCFFIDTAGDVAELFQVLDSLLKVGGVWVNVGPLNWRKEARLKLSYEEIVSIWQGMGYEFVTRKEIDCDYHLPRGFKMYTESYQGALTTAIKRR